MLALCVESSHVRGMGHFFRACVLADALVQSGQRVKFYINDHAPAVEQLKQRGFLFEVIPLEDGAADWENDAISRDKIGLWIYDRHITDARAAQRIKSASIPLVTFDDRGGGAAAADLHIAALAFDPDETLAGRRVVRGVEYLILNPEIAKYQRVRTSVDKIIVTLGGADTYGVTAKVMRLLSRTARRATIVVGPAFMHNESLAAEMTSNFEIKRNVPSLIAEFSRHDMAITGGGVTPFEANASGLPCIVVANEDFEVPVGRALASFGGAVFMGHHASLDETILERNLPVEQMSRAGLAKITIDGAQRVVEAVLAL